MLGFAALYPLMILDIAGHFVPVLVALASLRRARRSAGFNRWVYGYVAALSASMLLLLVVVGWSSIAAHIVALTGAWLTLPLWLCLRVLLRHTRSRPSIYAPYDPPQARLRGPGRWFTLPAFAARRTSLPELNP